ncbi:Uncharacterised protein [Mycobacteroides abscessus]|nr:Uncharacterised protein [Mycobacteroides abscessus]
MHGNSLIAGTGTRHRHVALEIRGAYAVVAAGRRDDRSEASFGGLGDDCVVQLAL